MSKGRRLATGFGIIALGVCAAMPFHRTAPPPVAAASSAGAEQLRLGVDLPLQVPGQPVVAEMTTTPPTPSFAQPEPDASPSQGVPHDTAMTKRTVDEMARPPAMPNQYRPLFRLSKEQASVTGRVVSSNQTARPRRRHTIHDGDTLASLASRYLGSASRATEIFEVNRNVLKDPELLPIGARIVIPRRRATAVSEPSRASVVQKGQLLVPLPANVFQPSR